MTDSCPSVGTWQSAPGQVEAAVAYALKDGYKLVDCAYCYGNEEEVGAGLKAAFDAGVKREDIFIVTKVWATYNTRCELALDKSLKALGLDYVDLFLVVSFKFPLKCKVLFFADECSTGQFSSTLRVTMTSSPPRRMVPEMSSDLITTSTAGSKWRSWSLPARPRASASAT